MMEDAILACKERGADPKAIRLWHKLNDKTEICVKTGVGLTEYTEVGAVVGQGTMGGALVSIAVLYEGTKELQRRNRHCYYEIWARKSERIGQIRR